MENCLELKLTFEEEKETLMKIPVVFSFKLFIQDPPNLVCGVLGTLIKLPIENHKKENESPRFVLTFADTE